MRFYTLAASFFSSGMTSQEALVENGRKAIRATTYPLEVAKF
jgi:hypothetical protein